MKRYRHHVIALVVSFVGFVVGAVAFAQDANPPPDQGQPVNASSGSFSEGLTAAGLAITNGQGTATVLAITDAGVIASASPYLIGIIATDVAGNGSTPILASSVCTCSGRAGGVNVCDESSGTTLTVQASVGNDTVKYHCLVDLTP